MDMAAILALVIALVILLFAVILYNSATEFLEEASHFWGAIWGFFILYALAAVGMYFLVIHPEERPSIADTVYSYFSILPSQLEQGKISDD